MFNLKLIKMKKISYLLIVVTMLIVSSCEPQMDDIPSIGEPPVGDFTIDNTDSNNLIFNAPEGYLYSWDFNGAAPSSNQQSVTVNYPFAGDYEVKLTLSGKGGSTIINKVVSVTTNDPAVGQKPVLKELTGSGFGKTWVYDTTNQDGYFYMTANYDWEEFWWQPADDGDIPAGVNSELTFDLQGGFNYSLVDNSSGSEMIGNFILDAENMTITFLNSNLPDFEDENLNPDRFDNNVYQIKILTDGSLLLWQDQQNDDYAWAWRFKPKQ
ncbi:MAG: hypothetical protein COC22_03505 [Flavobacteriaceae bacterium]|nr:MAG: hypothetical protein COC22_03505 [Flavobacteriaceae bacterium]